MEFLQQIMGRSSGLEHLRENHDIEQSDSSLFTSFSLPREGHIEYSDQSDDVGRTESFREAIAI